LLRLFVSPGPFSPIAVQLACGEKKFSSSALPSFISGLLSQIGLFSLVRLLPYHNTWLALFSQACVFFRYCSATFPCIEQTCFYGQEDFRYSSICESRTVVVLIAHDNSKVEELIRNKLLCSLLICAICAGL
jgi:hypothetical protein